MSSIDAGNSPLPSLGNLAQAARHNKLKQARSILIGLGALMLVVNGVLFGFTQQRVHDEFNQETAKLRQQGFTFDPEKIATLEAAAVRATQLLVGGMALVGVLYIVFGINIYRYPVPITIISLVLYVGVVAINGVLDPNTIWQGIVLKVIIVGGLVSAIRAAFAYQRESPVAAPESGG